MHDAIIIGAGISGMYQLHKLRGLGLSARVFEAGTDVGGTWYWNRYPGARFDSESYSYGYSFSPEILAEWRWSEHFAAQPETLRYCQYVADKLDLRRDITFGARVVRATFLEDERAWEIETEAGATARGRFLITAVGILSAPTMPTIDGVESFQGEAYHTGLWPHDDVTFAGKRVGVIGTGATGVQTIQEVAKTAAQLTVFQRTPNYCAPLVNDPIDDPTWAEIQASYPQIFARCRESNGAFLHINDRRSALEVSDAERDAFYEELYARRGFAIWMGNFHDIATDQAANDTISAFIAAKIRARVQDPETAEKLVPRDHGFGTRRVPLETRYYEAYNQPNVALVDIREQPIRRITATGIETAAGHHEFDMIIYATGFDAVTGAFHRMDITGRGGLALRQAWAEGPRTYLGFQTAGFPNLLTLVGPHNASTFCNLPRCIEQNVEWVSDLIGWMRAHDYALIEPEPDAIEAWTKHVYEMVNMTLIPNADSWFMGVNSNLPDKPRTFLAYAGGAPRYRAKCDEVAGNGYTGFRLTRASQ